MWLDRFLVHVEQTKTAEQTKAKETLTSDTLRASRFPLDVPMAFVDDGCEHQGRCINVSASGLLATFDKPPELWTGVELTLEAGEHFLGIKARVARVDDREVGFAFSINNDNDRATVEILVATASGVARPKVPEEPDGAEVPGSESTKGS